MPTYERSARFDRDYRALTSAQREQFRTAVRKFVHDLDRGGAFRSGLRVKGVKGSPGVFEMTWADDGRATFSYGESHRPGEPHIQWRRIGTHDVLGSA
jgi:hypothetical protein